MSFPLFLQVTKMTQLVRDAFIKNLDKLSWMSDLTKNNAREKVRIKVCDDQRSVKCTCLTPTFPCNTNWVTIATVIR